MILGSAESVTFERNFKQVEEKVSLIYNSKGDGAFGQ